MTLPAEIYSTESVRRIDRRAISEAHIDAYALMTRAGEAAFDLALDLAPAGRKWQIVCGAGNNAGDAYVVARLALARGIAVAVTTMMPTARLIGDAKRAFDDFQLAGGEVNDGPLDESAGLLIDGMLGSGLTRPIEGRYAEVIAAMNRHDAAVLALDLPSGLHGDSGQIMGVAVRADATITFVGLRSGLFTGEGPDVVGQLHFAGLDIPESCRSPEQVVMQLMRAGLVASALPRRPRQAHKKNFGHVLVVGGDRGMPGAVTLCGEAALRAGAGLVSIATHPSHSAFVPAGRPELMCHGVETAADLTPLMARATVVALGPGLGTSSWAKSLFDAVFNSERPVVADADALNLLAASGEKPDGWILTPHPGEAGTLLGITSAAVQSDRLAALAALKEHYGGTVVLKGAGTLVAGDADPPWLCTAGNPGMASPGTGDVLTGIIAALVAQGVSGPAAAAAGVLVHAGAGDDAAAVGERGLLASDLIASIRSRVNP